jgi:hypothetical protein
VALSGQASSVEKALQGVAADPPRFRSIAGISGGLVIVLVVIAGYGIFAARGREAAFSWIAGAVFGWVSRWAGTSSWEGWLLARGWA